MDRLERHMKERACGVRDETMTGDEMDLRAIGATGVKILGNMKMGLLVKTPKPAMSLGLNINHLLVKEGTSGSGVNSKKTECPFEVASFSKAPLLCLAATADAMHGIREGFSDTALDGVKAGSRAEEIIRWAGSVHHLDLKDTTGTALMRRINKGEDLRHLLVKGVLYLMQVNSAFTTNNRRWKQKPTVIEVQKISRKEALPVMSGPAKLLVCVDSFTYKELSLLNLIDRKSVV